MSYAILDQNNTVENIAEAAGPLAPNWILNDGSAQIGYIWNGARFNPPTVTLAQAQAMASSAVDSFYATYIAQGCPINFSSFGNLNATLPNGTVQPAGQQVLQTRDMTDMTNWLIGQTTYTSMVGAGQGDINVTIRTASNANVTLPASEALQVLLAMAQRGAGILAYSWALKNQIATATTVEAVNAINVAAGWPT